MNEKELLRTVVNTVKALPGAELTYPFGPDWDVYKVRNKVFMLITTIAGGLKIILKSNPEISQILYNTHPQITPGYHMNKKHWITLNPGLKMTKEEIGVLVSESYLLVVEKLPRKYQPVNPKVFGK